MRPPSVWAARRSRDLSRDRRSGACACRRRPPRRRLRARASVRRSGRRSVASVTPSSSSCTTTASMSCASSRTSSVRAGLASTFRCTMTSEPRDSRSSTVPFSRRSAGVSGASAASSRCSGRIPRITVEPRNDSSAGCAATVSSSSVIECGPGGGGDLAVGTAQRRLEHVHRRRADEAPDEQVDRPVVEILRVGHLLELALAHDRDTVAHSHRLDLVVGDVHGRDPEVVLKLGRSPHASARGASRRGSRAARP